MCLSVIDGIIRRKRVMISNITAKSIVFHMVMGTVFLGLYTLCMQDIVQALLQFLPGLKGHNGIAFEKSKIIIYMMGLLLYLYLLLSFTFPSKGNKKLIPVALLSIISGFGGAFIIVIINQALQNQASDWLKYFLLAIYISLYGGRVVRIKLIEISNRIVLDKRTTLIGNILDAPFFKMEKLDKGNILVCLNNDTETISRVATEMVLIITNSVTLLVSLIYLGTLNMPALLVTISLIVVAVSLYYVTSRKANKDWNKNREIQNFFYKKIDDLIYGFKELSMKKQKRSDFKTDITQSCEDFYETRVQGEKRFINVSHLGELMFFLIIGTVIFIFPLLFSSLETEYLFTYTLILIYISNQLNALLRSVPHVLMMKISWDRMNATIKQIEGIKEEDLSVEDLADCNPSFFSLNLKNICYQYDRSGDSAFALDSINCEFHPGEITFITGGNGSGKSTLAKIISGLYLPHKGEITLNELPVSHKLLSEQFTTIFSDFYLFEKLYGIPYESKLEEMNEYLKLLQIETKLSFKNGAFTSINLSTGQRKRLALLISYLEDAPIFLFDEWAADQDPEFRRFFYYELLPDLKRRQKCVIAITHDESYFHVADKHLKMDSGQLFSEIITKLGVRS